MESTQADLKILVLYISIKPDTLRDIPQLQNLRVAERSTIYCIKYHCYTPTHRILLENLSRSMIGNYPSSSYYIFSLLTYVSWIKIQGLKSVIL